LTWQHGFAQTRLDSRTMVTYAWPGFYERIRFNHVVKKIMRLPASDWRVEYQDAEGADHVEQFDVLMIANGHHWDPKYPDYPGTFNGKFIHSHDFKKVDDSWRGKNVLVIGGGNSACDVAVEAARVAERRLQTTSSRFQGNAA
jgi:cation diffusion facilitator CzcD-associated flavoprotein CzcO